MKRILPNSKNGDIALGRVNASFTSRSTLGLSMNKWKISNWIFISCRNALCILVHHPIAFLQLIRRMSSRIPRHHSGRDPPQSPSTRRSRRSWCRYQIQTPAGRGKFLKINLFKGLCGFGVFGAKWRCQLMSIVNTHPCPRASPHQETKCLGIKWQFPMAHWLQEWRSLQTSNIQESTAPPSATKNHAATHAWDIKNSLHENLALSPSVAPFARPREHKEFLPPRSAHPPRLVRGSQVENARLEMHSLCQQLDDSSCTPSQNLCLSCLVILW